MKLFTWTHFCRAHDFIKESDRPWVNQTHCVVVLPTKKAFCERFNYTLYGMKDWVSVEPIPEVGHRRNQGIVLACANPGTLYGHDIWRHTHGEYVWIEIPE